jgi:1,4-dihydroxy-2-naphthoate octaprenyltransferase
MSKNKAWINAMRLRTLPLSLSGIIVGSALAYYNDKWDTIIFSLALLTTILFQVLSNLANDLGDTIKGTDNEHRVGPERAVQSGVISQQEMKKAVAINSILCVLSSSTLIYFGARNMTIEMTLFYSILALLCILAAITYTIGKKAYGYHGMGDIMVFIFFGAVSVLGVFSLYSKFFDYENILPAISIGLLSVAVLNLNNMRDYVNDKNLGKNTIAVKIGPNQAKLYHVLLIMLALASFAQFINLLNEPILFLTLTPGIFLLFHLRKVMQITQPRNFDPELKKVALSTFAISLLFFLLIIYSGLYD